MGKEHDKRRQGTNRNLFSSFPEKEVHIYTLYVRQNKDQSDAN